MFLDEPTGALDEQTGRGVLDWLARLRAERGFTVGTGYQFGLLKMMTELMYSDVAGVGEYSFGVGIFFGVLAAFVALYEAATFVFARRLIMTPVKEIMLET